jgi:hypothetical protein
VSSENLRSPATLAMRRFSTALAGDWPVSAENARSLSSLEAEELRVVSLSLVERPGRWTE